MQEYKLISFEKSDFQDQHGNYWCTAAFEGVSEPVRWVLKDPMKVHEGESYYGEIKDAVSKAGKPYLRFYKQQNPQQAGTPTGNGTGWKDNSDGQRQGMCFNNATLFVNMMLQKSDTAVSPEEWAEMVRAHAKALYLRVDLAEAAQKATPEATPSLSQQYKERKTVAADTVFPLNEEEPINLDDIPF